MSIWLARSKGRLRNEDEGATLPYSHVRIHLFTMWEKVLFMSQPTFFTSNETGNLLSRHHSGGFIDNRGNLFHPNHSVTPMSKQIAIDFDGVIHSYTSGWKGATIVSDPPVLGAIEAIRDYITNGLRVLIFSTRNVEPGAVVAMTSWLVSNGLETEYVEKIVFPTSKPSTASVFIDDRAYLFEGTFPTVEYLKEFKPWNKR